MPPLSFTDRELKTVLEVGRVMPFILRKRYLKAIADELASTRDFERVINCVVLKPKDERTQYSREDVKSSE